MSTIAKTPTLALLREVPSSSVWMFRRNWRRRPESHKGSENENSSLVCRSATGRVSADHRELTVEQHHERDRRGDIRDAEHDRRGVHVHALHRDRHGDEQDEPHQRHHDVLRERRVVHPVEALRRAGEDVADREERDDDREEPQERRQVGLVEETFRDRCGEYEQRTTDQDAERTRDTDSDLDRAPDTRPVPPAGEDRDVAHHRVVEPERSDPGEHRRDADRDDVEPVLAGTEHAREQQRDEEPGRELEEASPGEEPASLGRDEHVLLSSRGVAPTGLSGGGDRRHAAGPEGKPAFSGARGRPFLRPSLRRSHPSPVRLPLRSCPTGTSRP
ncbi:MAG: hypothetical protein KatS3mg010_2098 [Acidimicrobiia bacterium]|nr:MAG: hypothetical protein KatS3mg010_2098 [Acidimicrobiia bacterium]